MNSNTVRFVCLEIYVAILFHCVMHFVSWLIAEHLNLVLKGLAGDNTLNNSEGMAIEILLKDNKNLET